MKYLLPVIALLLLNQPTHAQSQLPRLGESSKISLLTCGSGGELYSVFGHSALWVYDPVRGIDRIYNYGTFDFDTPNFYIRFIEGNLEYKLSINQFSYFFEEYVQENRSIFEQVLNLYPAEKQRLFELLEENYRPENRYYRYDFFWDNCSTRIRDIVWIATNNRFLLPDMIDEGKKLTYRQLLKPYLDKSPWLQTGMFLLLTRGADSVASPGNTMFLPEHMERLFRQASSVDGERLVATEKEIFHSVKVVYPKGLMSHTWILPAMVLLLLLASLYFEKSYSFRNKLLDTILFLLAGIMGILMTFMWLGSKHLVTHGNLNLVWTFPLLLAVAVLVWIPASLGFLRKLSRIWIPILVLTLLSLPLLPQRMPAAGVIFLVMIGVRLYRFTNWPVPMKKKEDQEANQ